MNFRDPQTAKKISDYIKKLAPKDYEIKFMHVCGTHEQTVSQYGLRSLLPENVEIIAGPGCPVCVVTSQEIDETIYLAREGKILATFGDMSRVPGTDLSLHQCRTEGNDVRIVYSPEDATEIAKENSDKEVVFFAIGFETTVAIVAAELLRNPPNNFSIICSHKTIPAAMHLLIGSGELQIDGFILPGHVSTIIGATPFEIFPRAFRMPVVIAGFEPVDVLMSIALLLKQIRDKTPKVDNEYSRVVNYEGNIKAQKMIDEVFEVATVNWRGIGRVAEGGYILRSKFEKYDARKKFKVKIEKSRDIHPGCSCHLIMIGKLTPDKCKLFGNECTPNNPYGPCMVSHEGTCNIWLKFGGKLRFT
ncbi:MAG: hydrogenase formation protein HypD [Candidatus Helarchaeota archaeon]|nr:hydrogenase formation protein HypD [Candidatus Helarchaeota archaeon]